MANIKPKWEEEHPPMRTITGNARLDARLSLPTIRFMSRDEVRRIRASARQEIGR